MNTEIDYREIETVLEHILGKQVNFGVLVSEITENGQMMSFGTWLSTIGNLLLEQLKSHGKNIAYLLLLIISAAMLSTIAKAFRNRQISDMGFYMIYLLMFLIMMRSFGVCYSLTEDVIADLVDFMKVLMPTYLMAAAVSAYRTSAVLYYEGFLLLIYYLRKLVAVFVLPAIRCYVLFSMLGHLGKEDFFSRGREGVKKVILFALKAMIGVAGGLQMIQGMISPAIDELKQTALSRGVSSLGNIGNIAQNVTDVVLGSGVLLKNGIGAVAAIVIVVICLLPVLEVGGYVVFYHVLAAVAEPISDKKLVSAIGDMGEGIGLLVKLLFTVGAMFLLTIAIICVTTGGI
ncbi:MAG: stage III sporulation protein AE [Lachnospiraceae bacterium]|nr:stage III sporulation protein AE [Lachnospiraceae bacterium]